MLATFFAGVHMLSWKFFKLKPGLTALLMAMVGFAPKPSHAHDHPAVHGMLMFGGKGVYLSHLPMFHHPHHYQVILKVKFNDKVEKAFFEDQKKNPKVFYTFEPATAVLPEIVAGKVPLKGTVYRGHFERGGVDIIHGVTAAIEKVVHFRKFDENEQRPALATYLLFGEPGDTWIAHVISKKPNFDHVASVSLSTNVNDKALAGNAIVFQIPGMHDMTPLESGSPVDAQSESVPRFKLESIETKYLEFGDLKM